MLWETSLLDAEEGIRFRGYNIPQLQVGSRGAAGLAKGAGRRAVVSQGLRPAAVRAGSLRKVLTYDTHCALTTTPAHHGLIAG